MSREGQRLLIVMPHPDDECFGCTSTIARYAAEGGDGQPGHDDEGRRRALEWALELEVCSLVGTAPDLSEDDLFSGVEI